MNIEENHKVIQNPTVTDFLASLFSELNQENIVYAVLRNHENLPEQVTGDVDILISPESLSDVLSIVNMLEQKFGVQSLFKSGVRPHVQRTYCLDSDILKLDFQIYLGKAGFKFINAKDFLLKRKKAGDFFILDAKDQLVSLLYHSIIYKKTFIHAYKILIKGAYEEGAQYYFERQLSKKLSQRIHDLLKANDFEKLLSLRTSILWQLTWKNKSNLLIGPLTLFLWFLKRVVGFIVPSGRFVAFVGPDGCGKTTIINNVSRQLSYDPFVQVSIVEMGFQKRGVLPTDSIYQWGRGKFGFRLIWPVIALFDFYLRYIFKIRSTLARGGIVLADRYVYNIGTGDYKFARKGWVKTILFLLTPRPHLCYIVKRDIQSLLDCRPEISEKLINAYYASLDHLRLKCLKPLANDDLETATQQCRKDIINLFLPS